MTVNINRQAIVIGPRRSHVIPSPWQDVAHRRRPLVAVTMPEVEFRHAPVIRHRHAVASGRMTTVCEVDFLVVLRVQKVHPKPHRVTCNGRSRDEQQSTTQ